MEFKILGPVEVWADGRLVQVAAGKQRAVLAILLLQANRVVSAERLIQLLWGDDAPETASNSLQVHVSQLRKALHSGRRAGDADQILITQAPGYLLRADPEDLDLGRFRSRVELARLARSQADWQTAAEQLREALSLWRGPALADLVGEDLLVAESQQLEELRLQALEERIGADLTLGAHSNLIAELEAVVAEHPLRERLRGQLMLALYRSGRQAESSALYQETRELLVDQLGMEPGPELQLLLKQILNQDSALDVKTPSMTIRRESRLPRLRDAFVGRRREMEQLARRLEVSPMLTLTGAGGIGKTRLAVELGASLAKSYRDGVVFVDLAPLADESLIPRTISSALGLIDDGVNDPMDVVTTHLTDRSVLVVLDNCEHVLPIAAKAAGEMLGHCRGLSILATSREALGVPGETTWEVLPLPNRRNGSANADVDLGDGDAVELFRLRAEAVAPKSFNWDDTALANAARICNRLDGIPLAIELAAACLRVMTLNDLLARLDSRFALLTTSARTAAPRHQSLEATVDWSYQLLSSAERLLLQRTAVFAGGFTSAAVEEVCVDEILLQADALPALFGLVEKSMIRSAADFRGRARYTMLETIREYSLNKLRASSGDAEARRRHAAYFSHMAASTEEKLKTEQQVQWMAQLEEEHGNFRTALEWAMQGAPEIALQIATSLGDYWRRNRIGEGKTWVTRAMEAAPTSELRTSAVDVAGQLARLVGDLDLARNLWSEAANGWAVIGDVPRAAYATDRLGSLHYELGDRELGLDLMNRAVEMLRPTGDQWRLASALNNLGYSLHRAGDPNRAKPLVDEALGLAKEAGDPWIVASILDSAADIEMSLGRHSEARAMWRECFAIVMRLGDLGQAAYVLEARARLALLEGDPKLSIRLIAAGAEARDSIGEPPPRDWGDVVTETLEAARSQLADIAADEAWRDGKTMTLGEAMTSVIEH